MIKNIPSVIEEYGCKKAFVFGDKNTFRAAGEQVCSVLDKEGIKYTDYILDEEMPEPDEKTVGSVMMISSCP